MQQLDLIFTRDFSLYTCEFWRNQLLKDIKRVWGKGFSDQITFYNGKVAETYRLKTEMQELKEYVIHLPLTHHLFSGVFNEEFKIAVIELREIIALGKPFALPYLEKILHLWSKMYPGYMLANFLGGPWADDFRKIQGPAAELIIKKQYDNRVSSEGLFIQLDNYLREYVSQKMQEQDYPDILAHLLTLNELKELLESERLPKLSLLQQRKKGFVIIQGKLLIDVQFNSILQKYGYNYNNGIIENMKDLNGTIAYASAPVVGKVSLVSTKEEISSFPAGNVLVTAMTSP